MESCRGKGAVGVLCDLCVADPTDHHVLWNAKTLLSQIEHGTGGDVVRGAEQTIRFGTSLRKQVFRVIIARIHAELRNLRELAAGGDVKFVKGTQKTIMPCLAGGLILRRNADDGRSFGTVFQHLPGKGVSRSLVIMANAVEPLKALPDDDDGYVHFFQHGFMELRKNGSEQNDAVHAILPEEFQGFDFLVRIIGGIHQDQLISFGFQDLINSFGDS